MVRTSRYLGPTTMYNGVEYRLSGFCTTLKKYEYIPI